MVLRQRIRLLLACAVLAFAAGQSVWAQTAERKIGFSVAVNKESFFSTTVSNVTVTKVTPDSQAQVAGVAPGDEIIKIQGTTVPGNSALKLSSYMDFVPGVPKRITFKRSNGSEYEVVFTRAMPAQPAE